MSAPPSMTLHSREVSLERPVEKPLCVAFLLRDAGEGGAERSSLRLANGLARRNVEVTLLLLRAVSYTHLTLPTNSRV